MPKIASAARVVVVVVVVVVVLEAVFVLLAMAGSNGLVELGYVGCILSLDGWVGGCREAVVGWMLSLEMGLMYR